MKYAIVFVLKNMCNTLMYVIIVFMQKYAHTCLTTDTGTFMFLAKGFENIFQGRILLQNVTDESVDEDGIKVQVGQLVGRCRATFGQAWQFWRCSSLFHVFEGINF